jgi:hypothetical protein
MSSYIVKCEFNDGSGAYTLPLIQTISDPKEGSKAVIHEGNRGNGSIHIPGGKKSQTITISGILYDEDGYEDLTTRINTLKAEVTTLPATLTLSHWDPDASGAGTWQTDWEYTVVRTTEIEIDDANEMRTDFINYTINFLVLSY